LQTEHKQRTEQTTRDRRRDIAPGQDWKLTQKRLTREQYGYSEHK
jgi:hypothetical protein